MKSFKKTVLATLIAVASFGSSVQAEPGKISDNVIRIGILNDMASVYALVGGPGSVVAARMAIEDFGKKTIHGARIELLVGDDQNNTAVAAARTKSWIEKDHVDMITGFVATSAALGSISEAAKKKVPIFVTGATSTGITNASCTPYTVHWMQDTYGLSIGTVKSLIESGKKTFYFVTADYAFGWALEKDASDMIKLLGGEVKGAMRAPFPGADFTEQLTAAKDSGAQVVAFANSGLDAVGTTTQANKMGLNKTMQIAPLLLFHADVQSLGPKILADTLMTIGFFWGQSPEAIEFSSRYYSRTHRMPDVSQAGVYSAVLQYLKAVDELGSDDGDEVMKYLKTPGRKLNDPIIKDSYVREDGKMMKPMYLIRIKKANEMKNDWDYYDLKNVIPAETAAIDLKNSKCDFIMKAAAKITTPTAPAAPAAAPTAAPKAVPTAPTASVAVPAVPTAPVVAPVAVAKPAAVVVAPTASAPTAPTSLAAGKSVADVPKK